MMRFMACCSNASRACSADAVRRTPSAPSMRTHAGRPAAMPRVAASAVRHRGAPAAAGVEGVHVAPAHARASSRPRVGLRASAAGGRRQARGRRRARGGRAGRRGGGGGRRRRRRRQAGRRGAALAPALELLVVEERVLLAQLRVLLCPRLIRRLAKCCYKILQCWAGMNASTGLGAPRARRHRHPAARSGRASAATRV